MSVASPISLQQYFENETKPASEYIHGESVRKTMPTKLHAELQVWISYLLLRSVGFARDVVVTEQNLRLAKDVVLIPDVCVLRRDSREEGPSVIDPPLLCIEILSASDKTEKCQDYLRWGVAFCWILSPESQHVWVASLTGIDMVPEDGMLTAGQISISFADIFRRK